MAQKSKIDPDECYELLKEFAEFAQKIWDDHWDKPGIWNHADKLLATLKSYRKKWGLSKPNGRKISE